MFYVLAFIALGILILVHEAGHMWIARLSGMRVDKFSIFFGPPLARWRGRKTTYQLATIPLGGFVQIAGMNPHEQLAPDDPGSYQNKGAWRRFATVAAGPLINYLFAMVLMFAVMTIWGLPTNLIKVEKVPAGKPAAQAGMKPGDVFVAVDGRRIGEMSQIFVAISESQGRPLTFRMRRGGELVDIEVTPRPIDGGPKIGVTFGRGVQFHEVGLGGALLASVAYPYHQSAKMLRSLRFLLTKKNVSKVGGPLEIVRQLRMSFEQGLAFTMLFIAMLSVLLGLFNLLPLPALDGGRLIFIGLEMIIRRPVNPKVENWVHTVGFLLLLGLILIVTVRDVQRLFGG